MQRDDKVIENRDMLLEMLIIEGIYNNKIKTFDTSKVPNYLYPDDGFILVYMHYS